MEIGHEAGFANPTMIDGLLIIKVLHFDEVIQDGYRPEKVRTGSQEGTSHSGDRHPDLARPLATAKLFRDAVFASLCRLL